MRERRRGGDGPLLSTKPPSQLPAGAAASGEATNACASTSPYRAGHRVSGG